MKKTWDYMVVEQFEEAESQEQQISVYAEDGWRLIAIDEGLFYFERPHGDEEPTQ